MGGARQILLLAKQLRNRQQVGRDGEVETMLPYRRFSHIGEMEGVYVSEEFRYDVNWWRGGANLAPGQKDSTCTQRLFSMASEVGGTGESGTGDVPRGCHDDVHRRVKYKGVGSRVR